jgi:hypothetical protein
MGKNWNVYSYTNIHKILQHIDLLLGNDSEISSYTTAVVNEWLCKRLLLVLRWQLEE